jgi:hypothetical protein
MSDESEFTREVVQAFEAYDRDKARKRRGGNGKDEEAELPSAISFDDFLGYSPENKFIFRPTGTLWGAGTLNARLPWIGGVKPSTLIMRNQAVEQMTWMPGEDELIRHRLVVQGGWVKHVNATVYNLYLPPDPCFGEPAKAAPWVDHVHTVYPEEADDIIRWLACRVQRPNIKINHALLLGGEPGVGKDSLLFPVIQAVGPWNCQSVSPQQMLGRFNGHHKSVLEILTEARDLGEVNRPALYEHLKNLIAAPPDVILIDEKNRQPYYIPNLVGVIITTNHKAGGIFLTAEDRRHLVCWSPLAANQPGKDYFDRLWNFYEAGGAADVAAYLLNLDLTAFNPKAPPRKTNAFWEIVHASRQSECDELRDALEAMAYPSIVTLDDVTNHHTSKAEFNIVLRERKNRRQIARWFEDCGYVSVANPGHKQGIWKINGKYQMAYGQKDKTLKELYRLIQAKMS